MITRIILLLLFCLTSFAAPALTQQGELLLTAGMDCYESKDLHCASQRFETALFSEESGMNPAQRRSIKKILYSIYFRLAQEMVLNRSFTDLQTLCDKGIALGVELGLEEGVASKSFHIWYTIALLRQKGTSEGREIADRLQQIQPKLTTAPSEGQLSFLGSNLNGEGQEPDRLLE